MRRTDASFSARLLGPKPADRGDVDRALSIFVRNTSPLLRTKTNQIRVKIASPETSEGNFYFAALWRHADALFQAGSKIYSELKNLCVWEKTNAGQGSFYRNQHELVFVYKHGTATHINTFQLGQNGRSRTNVWRYSGGNCFRAGRMDELKMHPTVKPVALIVDAMRDCSKRGSIVLDVFAGSGSTIMAAEQIGRLAFCMEIDPHYTDVAIMRWQKFSGRDAILEATGQTFATISAERGAK